VDGESVGIKVLGPLAVDGSGRLGRRDRAALLALAVRQGESVTPDELVDAVWGDTPPASAHKNIQSCIVRLRRALGAEAIETTDHGYRLVASVDELDASSFEQQVARARDLLAVGELDRVVFQLEKALALWRGRAYDDLPDWQPARREAGRLEELRLYAEEMLVDAELGRGRSREVLARAHEMVRAAPLRERRWELLALAQYRTGAQGEALRTIRQLRAVLARDLGIDPSPEVVALEQSILQQDPSLLVSAPPPVDSHCPWQGLRAYDVDDAERFFGRDADVAACLSVLARGGFLAVVGPSGSGKSSLLRAGVLAALRQRGQGAVVITPGPRPADALSALDPTAPAGTVLAVDQAEEAWTMCGDLGERQAFLEALVVEAGRRQVVLAIRGDHLTRVTDHPAFGRLVEQGLHLVGAMDDDSLREAVERPAQQAGLVIEPGLVDLLVREVRDDPGALPLLSHALLETWRRREGSTLTVDGYRASGGIHGAVAQSAEDLYARMDDDQRRRLRDLVLRLVSPSADGDAVRTRVPRRLVAADAEHDRLIDALVAARLVTSDDEVLEITHEALARAWPRLRGWLEDDVEGQRIRHHLSGAADAWDGLGRPDSELYRGIRLTRALDWAASTQTVLVDTERDFLEAARVQAELEERSAAERARDQARMIRRLRIVLVGAVVLLVLALLAGGFAAVQSDRASRNAAEARQAALSADARRVGVRAQLTDDISLSLLLAAAGARLNDSPETRANLLAALAKQPTLVRSAPPGGGFIDLMSISPDGRWIAASDDQNRMHLYDAATIRVLRSYDAGPAAEDEAVMVGAFSPDSTELAVLPQLQGSTEPVRLLDPHTMQPTTELASPGDEPVLGFDLEFSADGRYLAATLLASPLVENDPTLTPGYAAVWDLRSPATPPVRVPTGTDLQGIALSPDGQTLYTGRPLTAYDVGSGDTIWREPELSSGVLDVNTQGTLLALDDALLVDTVNGDTVHTLTGHRDGIFEVRFSPDGSLVGAVDNGELLVWHTATGRLLARWETSDPWGVGFSADNDLVYSGGGDSMLRTWDLSEEDTYLRQTAHVAGTDPVAQADISPDGQHVAYRSLGDQDSGWVRFVDTLTGEATPATRLPVNEGPYPLGSWHPEGRHYAAHCEGCAATGIISVLDTATGELVPQRDVVDSQGGIWSLAYVDRGRSLLVGGTDQETLIVDAETLGLRGEPFGVVADCCATPIGDGSTALVYEHAGDHASAHWRVIDIGTGDIASEGDVDVGPFASIASPDGSTVALAGGTGEIVTLDVSTGDQQRSTGLGTAIWWLSYSDDGELLVSGSEDGGVSLWDATTLDLLGTVHPPQRGDPVPSAAQFIGDSHDVAIASYDGTIYRWDTDLDRAIDFACRMAGRDLTEEEWQQYLPTQPYRPVCPDE
jgi:DNA-binding SARP family transcriptional activator/WD40 repeat protein